MGALGRMEEMIAHYKPIRMRQDRETYLFWNVAGKRVTIEYHGKDEENRNLYSATEG